jgi:polyamine oxidase
VTEKGSSVVVSLANGTQLTADYVIVTASLGVLKEGVIKFDPPLPADKQAAIKDMVGGTDSDMWGTAVTPASTV